ncbi:LOW QUALITY PROTEIN: hypothetical protein PanWU01x14_022180 [Parasponia andersonii]|uniref:Uncharacterized protein n=1 Tax=Parasponia andersonii TaxID=3476 RepID=A0A2P5DX53_PARAD|nr:LOW QUALITY PROTEIN: hypothetical protein PanWU01x14_022180 [Parasponia andersonii]
MIPQAICLLEMFIGGWRLKPAFTRDTPRCLGFYPFEGTGDANDAFLDDYENEFKADDIASIVT